MSYKAAQWDLSGRSGSAPEVKGVRCFSLKELEKYTNHFSEANVIGSGGYGKVSFDCHSMIWFVARLELVDYWVICGISFMVWLNLNWLIDC